MMQLSADTEAYGPLDDALEDEESARGAALLAASCSPGGATPRSVGKRRATRRSPARRAYPYVGSTGRGARVGRRDGRGEGFCVGAAETSSVGWPVGVPASQDTPRFHQQSPSSAGSHSQHG